jgi:hypothetical protein
MKLKYTLDLPDMIAFHQFWMLHSDAMRLRRRKVMLYSACAYLAFGVMMALAMKSVIPLFFWLLLTAGYLSWYSRSSRRAPVRQLQKIYGPGGPLEKLLGEYEIEPLQDGIRVRAPREEYKTPYSQIQRIVETQKYAFLYNSPDSAIILPKARVTEGDFPATLQELRKRWEQRQSMR